MNINVPRWAEAEFWDEPPEGSWEFWSFRFPPPCKVGDPLVFKMRGVVVARAVCAAIERPGQSKFCLDRIRDALADVDAADGRWRDGTHGATP